MFPSRRCYRLHRASAARCRRRLAGPDRPRSTPRQASCCRNAPSLCMRSRLEYGAKTWVLLAVKETGLRRRSHRDLAHGPAARDFRFPECPRILRRKVGIDPDPYRRINLRRRRDELFYPRWSKRRSRPSGAPDVAPDRGTSQEHGLSNTSSRFPGGNHPKCSDTVLPLAPRFVTNGRAVNVFVFVSDPEHEHGYGHGNLSQIGPSCQAVSSLVEGWTMCWVPVYKRVQATQIQLLGGSKMTRVVGRPTPRVEGELKVTGKALYSADLKLPDTLWGKVLRSPIPYGRIKSIDVSKAWQVPGVKAVITGQDVTGLRIGRCIYDTPVLADGVVRFIGEKVAAVAAETEEAAEKALDLIEVEYDELEPLLDPVQAAKPDAPVLHPDLLSYKGLPVPVEKLSNVFAYIKWGKGNIVAGFKQADLIVENTFTTQVTHQSYLEPHACVVKADSSGGAEVWSCSKTPFAVRTQLSNCIGVAKEKLIFHPVHIGGDFGGKGGFMDVPACYFLSLKSGQPVKMVMDYSEELMAGNPRHPSIIKVKTGVKKNGLIVAHHLDFLFDSGAYGSMKPAGYLIGAQTCAGPYKIFNCLIEERLVYTNKIPCGHMRAPGDPQGFFANESQMDIVARKLDMDPAEFKGKNMLHDGDETPIGSHISHIRGVEALEKAIQLSGYLKPKPKNVGRGLSFSEWSPSGGEGNVFVTIDESGTVKVSTPVVDQGAGVLTVIVEVVGEELQVPADGIELTQ